MDPYKKAIDIVNRPDTDVSRDPNRKPDEVLRFFQVHEGDKVGEINAGRGYFSACAANVVGDILDEVADFTLREVEREIMAELSRVCGGTP